MNLSDGPEHTTASRSTLSSLYLDDEPEGRHSDAKLTTMTANSEMPNLPSGIRENGLKPGPSLASYLN
jgi:hypothetical protein